MIRSLLGSDSVEKKAVSSLRYRPNATLPGENKFGYVIFSGDATECHHWDLRTNLKSRMAKPEDYNQVVQNGVENLRGPAMQVAVEIGLDVLLNEDKKGLEKLQSGLRAHIFPVQRAEAK